MSDAPRFYLIHGDDDVGIEEDLKKIRQAMGNDPNAEMSTSQYEAGDITVPDILNKVSSMPFLSDKRLLIVKGLVTYLMKTSHGKDQLERLIDEVPDLPDYARLVLVERGKLRKNLRIVKLAQEIGYCKAHATPDARDHHQWIVQRAQHDYETDIEPAAAHALASVTEGDLRRADNELVKLVSYVAGERAITEADVSLLTPYVPEAQVFDMIDALSQGDGTTAMSIMVRALDEDPSDPGFRMFGLISSHFKALLMVREYLDNGGNRNERTMGKELKMHWYRAKKLRGQSRAFSVKALEKIYRRLQEYDEQVKTGRIHIRMALELFVASVAKN